MLVPCKELLKRIKVAKPTTMRAIDLGTVIVAATVQGGMVGFKGLKYEIFSYVDGGQTELEFVCHPSNGR